MLWRRLFFASPKRRRRTAVLLGRETKPVLRQSNVAVLAMKHLGRRLTFVRTLLDKRLRDKEALRFGWIP